MGISFSSISDVGKGQLLTSSSNGEPNWSYIPTAGKFVKSESEFVSEIKELAYSIYWSEYRSVKGNSELAKLPDYLEERCAFDAKA